MDILNAFCVDLEEWWNICATETKYSNHTTWEHAPKFVEKDTEVLLKLLDEFKVKGTFLTLGWIAEKYPTLIQRIANAGHEIGCHSYYHNLISEQSPEEFEKDLVDCLDLLRTLTGQPVISYRAPGFSMTRSGFWVYPILRKHGILIDVSIVPAKRNHGGVDGFSRNIFSLSTPYGEITCWPVSVVNLFGKTVPFSGGGYLRLFPKILLKYGFYQNHKAFRPCMSYIHPREINNSQPRLELPLLRYFKYYYGLSKCEDKLRYILKRYRFSTVSHVIKKQSDIKKLHLDNGHIINPNL